MITRIVRTDVRTSSNRAWKGWVKMDYEREQGINLEYTNEEYREKLKCIFEEIEQNERLRFWYRYVKAIEKGED